MVQGKVTNSETLPLTIFHLSVYPLTGRREDEGRETMETRSNKSDSFLSTRHVGPPTSRLVHVGQWTVLFVPRVAGGKRVLGDGPPDPTHIRFVSI